MLNTVNMRGLRYSEQQGPPRGLVNKALEQENKGLKFQENGNKHKINGANDNWKL